MSYFRDGEPHNLVMLNTFSYYDNISHEWVHVQNDTGRVFFKDMTAKHLKNVIKCIQRFSQEGWRVNGLSDVKMYGAPVLDHLHYYEYVEEWLLKLYPPHKKSNKTK